MTDPKPSTPSAEDRRAAEECAHSFKVFSMGLEDIEVTKVTRKGAVNAYLEGLAAGRAERTAIEEDIAALNKSFHELEKQLTQAERERDEARRNCAFAPWSAAYTALDMLKEYEVSGHANLLDALVGRALKERDTLKARIAQLEEALKNECPNGGDCSDVLSGEMCEPCQALPPNEGGMG